MRIAFGADERNHVTDFLIADLRARGHELTLYGPVRPDAPAEDEANLWPRVAHRVAEDVITGRADEGVVCCWTGTGVSIAANKVPGIRAALCTDAETARGARLWNRANVLALSLRLISEPIAKEILDQWFATPLGEDGVDVACVAYLDKIEGATTHA
ncbi:MAG: RpiB/LacA/LacB family sugar-phosphate isomerase [Caldilineales bacterium]|nr:RpiB/LacA/LacB family sugar-phosphate isomerase [Caldilineales bacterium]